MAAGVLEQRYGIVQHPIPTTAFLWEPRHPSSLYRGVIDDRLADIEPHTLSRFQDSQHLYQLATLIPTKPTVRGTKRPPTVRDVEPGNQQPPRLALHRGHSRPATPASLQRSPLHHPLPDGRVRAEAETPRVPLLRRVVGLVRGGPGQCVEDQLRLAEEREGNGYQRQVERAREDEWDLSGAGSTMV